MRLRRRVVENTLYSFSSEEGDYNKCHRVIRSCRTISHATVALNMVCNYGRAYGRGVKWEELDLASKAVWYYLNDLEPEERCRGLEQETSVYTKGQSMWLERHL